MALLSYFHKASYNYLMGYMIAVVLIFKSSLLSLWFLSKLKFLHFLKGLTIFQALLLGIKRWFIDNMVSKWLEKHIIRHFKKPFQELFQYYNAINFKSKIKNIVIFILPLGIGIWIMYLTDVLSHIAVFMELKVFVIGFFKALWVIFAKIFLWMTSSWFAPILEVFALSYLLTLLERFLGKNNPISRFFNYIGDKLNDILEYIGLLNDKHIEPILTKNVSDRSANYGSKISLMIKNKKIKSEYLYFDNFQNLILKGHINAYHAFDGMDKISDKKKLYRIINEETADNIDIIAYVSRNGKGELLEEPCKDSYYHDIFLLKGIASNRDHGVQEHLEEDMDYSDFWVLNSSRYPVWIKSDTGNIENIKLNGHEMRLIKTKTHATFKNNDIYFQHEGVSVSPTPIVEEVIEEKSAEEETLLEEKN